MEQQRKVAVKHCEPPMGFASGGILILMVYGAALKKRQRRKRNQTAGGIIDWWPFVLGIALTPLALRAADYFALTGPAALEALYPYALLMRRHEIPLNFSAREQIAHAVMYLQFPVYGLLLMLTMRVRSFGSAFVQVLLVHIFGVGGLWMLNNLVK